MLTGKKKKRKKEEDDELNWVQHEVMALVLCFLYKHGGSDQWHHS